MNDLETLNDIAIDIKRVKENIEFQKKIDTVYKTHFGLDESSRMTKLNIQIKDLENRRKRILNRMYKKYCT